MATQTRTTSLPDQHLGLAQRILNNKPTHISDWAIADSTDFDEVASHLDVLLIDTITYVRACLQDLKSKSNIDIEDAIDHVNGLWDTRGDIVGTLIGLADDLRGVPSMRGAA